MLKPPILCKKKPDKTSLDRDSLLGRICNPTAISMSICNAENGKAKADYKSARSDLLSDRYKYEHL